ncbi:uncharacterized protein TEOVI_000793500 [Trypanosoma equiperdum]|uniref:Uncharacterized protein n=2 Tax=Trypanozoon TaxID=39700 RepID=Q580V5_TRYB2|nr:hypothetical protein, conserved [Trypanosoma brucei brucei TREU927]AAX81029.1 hypothetical protein, conserved [Trypanosoma brucei]AAZ10551.1 hypothetical protein, conserved [Trypanosoma brucei brucei TREU927]SCU64818.1 hypothetical protein, conserved [Trypanosoma equiperdum]
MACDDSTKRNAAAVNRLLQKTRAATAPNSQWLNSITRREDGTLSNELHLSNQQRLACEMGVFPKGHFGDVEIEEENPQRSCHALAQRRARHEWKTDEEAKRRLQIGRGEVCNKRELRAAARREAAILRYEMTLPRRRVVGHLSHLMPAQADASLAVPTEGAADALVEKGCGRWVLHNSYRQQLLHGEPVMTRIMRGEFYETKPPPQRKKKVWAAGKRHVRMTSEVNRLMNTGGWCR